MAATLEELRHPITVVDALFAQRFAAGGNAGRPPAEWGERAHFVQALGLDNEENFARIPCLNEVEMVENIQPYSLVRYRCLVQDVFEPEYYAGFLEERDIEGAAVATPPRFVTTKYRECVDVEPAAGRALHDVGVQGLSQRGACYCVPLPGETAWARAAAAEWTRAGGGTVVAEAAPARASAASKRTRGDEDVDMGAEEPRKTRPQESGSGQAPAAAGGIQFSAVSTGDPVMDTGDEREVRSANEFGLNFPLPWEERHGCGSATACIVKLYDDDESKLQVCNSVEVIGILCIDPQMASFDSVPLAEARIGKDARDPSTALVPRLHALLVRPLPFHHPMLPFTPAWLAEARLTAAYQNSFSAPGALAAARSAALGQLARYLGGDALAAEYMLMQLVSRAFSTQGEMPLGAWSLNLAKWPEGTSAAGISAAAGELVPRSVYLEITTETLNTRKWRPRKDFVANRLVAAQLQLAPGTLLVLDETKMTEGEVTAHGVRAVNSITGLVTDQKLHCDFAAYDVKLPLEVFCVLVSLRRSIIKGCSVVLPLRPTVPLLTEVSAVQPGSLDAARLFLGLMTRSPRGVKIPEEVAKKFSEDFAAVRQELNIVPETSHAWLNLARAYCFARGEDELSGEAWSAVLALEHERLVRLKDDGMLHAQS